MDCRVILLPKANRFYVPIDKILKFQILRNFNDNFIAKYKKKTLTPIQRWFY